MRNEKGNVCQLNCDDRHPHAPASLHDSLYKGIDDDTTSACVDRRQYLVKPKKMNYSSFLYLLLYLFSYLWSGIRKPQIELLIVRYNPATVDFRTKGEGDGSKSSCG